MSTHCLEVKKLSKNITELRILDELSFTVEPGTVTALVGPNGAGKSTCLKILAAQQQLTSGKITYPFKQKNINRQREHIAYAYQKTALIPEMSVLEFLNFSGKLFGVSEKDLSLRIDLYLKKFKVDGIANKKIEQLSGGMQRIVDLIRTLLHQPKVLLFDEPTHGLDVERREFFWELIHDYCQENNAFAVVATHLMNELSLCDQVVFLKEGKLIKLGEPNSLHQEIGNYVLEVGPKDNIIELESSALQHIATTDKYKIYAVKNDGILKDISKQLGSKLTQVNIRKPNLEDVFLWLTAE